jgi:RNA polymerase sigma-70 factor (ECF subfamily)
LGEYLSSGKGRELNVTVGEQRNDEVAQLRDRREDAMADFFGQYRGKLLRMIALRVDCRLLSKVDSEDILQEAFVTAARRIDDYLDRPTVPVIVWLRQITTQVLVDTHRRYLGAEMRDVRQEVTLRRGQGTGTRSGFLVAHLADSLTSPSQCAIRQEQVGAMRTALEQLGEIDREVLVLRHLEQLSNHEVAEILGIDRYAASKRYLRALARLRRSMPVPEPAVG